MGQTTFSGPLLVGKKDTNEIGEMLLTQEYDLVYTQTGAAFATDIVLPAGARIVDIYLDITATFNAATTLEIGDGTDADKYADFSSLLAAGAGRLVGSYDAAQIVAIGDIGASDVTITVTPTTESASSGAGTLVVTYLKR